MNNHSIILNTYDSIALLLLLSAYFGWAFPWVRLRVSSIKKQWGIKAAVPFVTVLALPAFFTPGWVWLVGYAGIAVAAARLRWLLVLCLWLPFEFGFVKRWWGDGSSGAPVIASLFAINLLVFLGDVWHGDAPFVYAFRVERQDLRKIFLNITLLLSVVVPLGLGTGFLVPAFVLPAMEKVALTLVGTALLVAWPEELLFRGFIQGSIDRALGRTGWSLAIGSVVFGLAHLNNGPTPDWRYFMLATIAGGFYGRTFRTTSTLLAPALVHFTVDVVWALGFKT